MKILMLISSLYPERIGGIQKIGTDLAQHLALKHQVKVYTRYIKNFPKYEIRDNYEIKRLKSSHDLKFKTISGIRTITIIRQLMKEQEKPELIFYLYPPLHNVERGRG